MANTLIKPYLRKNGMGQFLAENFQLEVLKAHGNIRYIYELKIIFSFWQKICFLEIIAFIRNDNVYQKQKYF